MPDLRAVSDDDVASVKRAEQARALLEADARRRQAPRLWPRMWPLLLGAVILVVGLSVALWRMPQPAPKTPGVVPSIHPSAKLRHVKAPPAPSVRPAQGSGVGTVSSRPVPSTPASAAPPPPRAASASHAVVSPSAPAPSPTCLVYLAGVCVKVG